ncbi:MAG: alanine dehydrogenase, partial [Motiliproteus sp.]|nr:alanine dehydrogenase [Motiliproteus sp.]
MRIAIPKEIKVHEYRVGLTPAGVRELVSHGHEVLVQQDAGAEIGFSDQDYRRAGADIEALVEALF